MTLFKTGVKYSGRIGDFKVVLLPSIQPGHHYIRILSRDDDKPLVNVGPTPVFSDYIPTFLRHKGFDVDQIQWWEYLDSNAGDRHHTKSAAVNIPY